MPTAPTKPGQPAATATNPVAPTPVRPAADTTTAPVVATRVRRVEFRFDTEIFPKPDGVEDWSGGPRLETAELPSTYNPAKHRPLRRVDFKNDWDFLEFKARAHDKVAADLRKAATDAKNVGSVGDIKKARKLQVLQTQMAALLNELKSDGKTDLSKFMDDEVIKALMAKTEQPQG